MSRSGAETGRYVFGPGVADGELAHTESEMACFTCHLSLDHELRRLPPADRGQLEDQRPPLRGRGDAQLRDLQPAGRARRHVPARAGTRPPRAISSRRSARPRRSSCPRPTSTASGSTSSSRRSRAAGFSSQAFAPHFPHTVRTTETKTCSDCHVSAANDNNAIMAQLLLLGTNFVNFVGLHAWVGLDGGFEAVRVTEWDEPQAVIGSYLQRFAYPDYYRLHVERNRRELIELDPRPHLRPQFLGRARADEQFANIVQGTPDRVGCLQLRGEYMFVAEGQRRLPRLRRRQRSPTRASPSGSSPRRSRRSARTPMSRSRNATCMALPTNQPIAPTATMRWRSRRDACRRQTITCSGEQEQRSTRSTTTPSSPTPRKGLILVNVDTLADGEPRNNNLKRAVTWNEGGVLERRAPHHARRPFRLYRRRCRPGRRRPRRSAPPAPRRHRSRWPTRAPRRSSSAICG